MTDIRDAKFYVCEDDIAIDHDLTPVDFDVAFREATAIADRGGTVHVMYTEDASQSQLTEFARVWIRAALVAQG